MTFQICLASTWDLKFSRSSNLENLFTRGSYHITRRILPWNYVWIIQSLYWSKSYKLMELSTERKHANFPNKVSPINKIFAQVPSATPLFSILFEHETCSIKTIYNSVKIELIKWDRREESIGNKPILFCFKSHVPMVRNTEMPPHLMSTTSRP